METNNRFAQFSSNFRRLNVERLIEHYIVLCSGLSLEENLEEKKEEHQLHNSIYSQNNHNIHRCRNNGRNTSELMVLNSKAISKLNRLIEIFDRNTMSLKEYYKLVITFSFISLKYHSYTYIRVGGILLASRFRLPSLLVAKFRGSILLFL